MIVWRGWGILVLVISFACALSGELIAKSFGGDDYWDTHRYPLSAALLVASGLIWVADFYLYRNPGRMLRDEQTGERVLFKRTHDLFYIRMKWWSLVCVAGAVVHFFGPFDA